MEDIEVYMSSKNTPPKIGPYDVWRRFIETCIHSERDTRRARKLCQMATKKIVDLMRSYNDRGLNVILSAEEMSEFRDESFQWEILKEVFQFFDVKILVVSHCK